MRIASRDSEPHIPNLAVVEEVQSQLVVLIFYNSLKVVFTAR